MEERDLRDSSTPDSSKPSIDVWDRFWPGRAVLLPPATAPESGWEERRMCERVYEREDESGDERVCKRVRKGV